MSVKEFRIEDQQHVIESPWDGLLNVEASLNQHTEESEHGEVSEERPKSNPAVGIASSKTKTRTYLGIP
ncbi:hypothetical protein VTI74DRAFT_9380 [Chaetomium olivicolor]